MDGVAFWPLDGAIASKFSSRVTTVDAPALPTEFRLEGDADAEDDDDE
jgi:hypothetical protein